MDTYFVIRYLCSHIRRIDGKHNKLLNNFKLYITQILIHSMQTLNM